MCNAYATFGDQVLHSRAIKLFLPTVIWKDETFCMSAKGPWLLASGQVLLAILLNLYAPHQYWDAVLSKLPPGSDRHVQLGVDYFVQHWPPPAEQVSWAINFPARVLTIPFIGLQRPLISYAVGVGKNELTVADIIFFLWVGVLWYWIGTILRAPSTSLPKSTRYSSWRVFLVIDVSGMLFALIVGVFGAYCTLTHRKPYQHIGPFGVLWALALMAYFYRRLKTDGVLQSDSTT